MAGHGALHVGERVRLLSVSEGPGAAQGRRDAHLRLRRDGISDMSGGFGPWAIFDVLSGKDEEHIRLRNKGNPKHFLAVKGGKVVAGMGAVGDDGCHFDVIPHQGAVVSLQCASGELLAAQGRRTVLARDGSAATTQFIVSEIPDASKPASKASKTAAVCDACAPEPAELGRHRAQLLTGIEAVPRSGSPGCVAVFGDGAFAVLTTAGSAVDCVFAAAAPAAGAGRIFVATHDSYIRNPMKMPLPSATHLVTNAVGWLCRGNASATVGVYGEPPNRRMAKVFKAAGLAQKLTPWNPTAASAGTSAPDLLIWLGQQGSGTVERDPHAPLVESIVQYVRGGGSLLVTMTPWGFEQVTQASTRSECAENHVLRHFGIVFSSKIAGGRGGPLKVAESQPELVHGGRALQSVVSAKAKAGDVALGDGVCKAICGTLQCLPLNPAVSATPFIASLQALVGDATKANSFCSGGKVKSGVEQLAVTYFCLQCQALAPQDMLPASGIARLLGEVPAAAPRVERTIEYAHGRLDNGWQSTGLYLAPAESLSVSVVGGNPAGWCVRVGCHADKLWDKDEWARYPEIAVQVPLAPAAAGPTVVCTPFGGPVYIVKTGRAKKDVAVRVAGAVEAPLLVVDDPASVAAWPASRGKPGPWGELVGRRITLSVPSYVIRDHDPAAAVRFWDSVVDSHVELRGEALGPQRIVPDVQISAGYMHSGYPIMCHLDQVKPKKKGGVAPILDVETLKKDGNWGLFHEIGHNCQKPFWTFDGTIEVTCNLFTLYSMENRVGIVPWRHKWLNNQKKKASEYWGKASHAQWKSNAGPALVVFGQLQKHFGWQVFKDYFRQCKAEGKGQAPNQDKIDAWVRGMSLLCKHDLRPFFGAWSWPMSAGLKSDAQLAKLPAFKPDPAELTPLELP